MSALTEIRIDQKLEYLVMQDNQKKIEHSYHQRKPMLNVRFIYIYKGKGYFTLSSGESFEAGAKDMIYLPYGEKYTSFWRGYEDDPEIHYFILDIVLKDNGNNVVDFGAEPGIIIHDSASNYKGIFNEIIEEYNSNPIYSLACVSLVFRFCYEVICNQKTDKIPIKYQKIMDGIFYINNNYLDSFTIGDLAKMCAVSESCFRRLFYEYKGRQPIEFKNSLRIRKAKELLMTGKYTVTEVASMVNCGDLKYFSKMFKRYMGCTPSKVLQENCN